MRKIVKRSVDRQISAMTDAGFPPAAVLLSREKYVELLQELAYDRATDHIEPIAAYDGILLVIAPGENVVSVVPNAEVHWHNASEIDEITAPIERKQVVRFTEI